MAEDKLVDAFDPEIQKKHEQYLKDGTYAKSSTKRAHAQALLAAGVIRGGDLVAIQKRQADPSQVKMRPQASFKPAPSLPAPRAATPRGGSRSSGRRVVETIGPATRKPAGLQAINDLAIRLYTGGQELLNTLGGAKADPTPPPQNAGDWIGNLVMGGAKLPLAIATAPITGSLTLQKLVTDASTQSALQKNLKARGMGAEAKTFQREANKQATADLGGFLLPASGELSELAFGDPKKAGEMLKMRALTDPASLVLDAVGAAGAGMGARAASRKAPVLARSVAEGVSIARQPVRPGAMETVRQAAKVLPAPPPGPATARAGIPGFAPKPKAQPIPTDNTLKLGEVDGTITSGTRSSVEPGGAAGGTRPEIAAVAGNPGETPTLLRPGGDGSPATQTTGGDVPRVAGAPGLNGATSAAHGLRTELVAPEQVGILPGMQYKRGINKEGVTDLLKGQKDYEIEHGGTLTAFRDKDGNLLAVDGHHRRELAQRAERFTAPAADGSRIEVPRQLPVQILDAAEGWTPESAKTFGVLKNLRENKGVAIDAADALAASLTPEQARSEAQKLPKTPLARDVAGLVLLDEAGRTAVRNKQLTDSVGAAIGEVLRGDIQRQRVAIEQAQNTQGIRSYDDGAALARAVRDEEIIAKQDEGSLFGDDDSIGGARFTSTAGEQALIAQSVKRRLQQEQSGLLAVEKTQQREGERFDVQGRRQEAGQVAEARSKADALLEFDPEVKGILRQAAADVMNGRIGRDEGVKRVREVLIKNGSANLAEIVRKGTQPPQAQQDGAAPELPQGGGLFGGQDSVGRPLPSSGQKEPWQMTQSEFLEANKGRISQDESIGQNLFRRVGRLKGKPGISDEPLYSFEKTHMEGGKFVQRKVPATIDDIMGEGRNIIYRDDNGNPIGILQFHIDPDMGTAMYPQVHVLKGHRGKGIASALYKYAQEHEYDIEAASGSTDFTAPGAKFNHARQVANALEQGKPVPAEVLADYPKLKSSSGGQDSTAKPLPASDSTADIKNISNPSVTRIAPAPLADGTPAKSAKEISLDLGKALGRRLDYGAKGRGKNVLGTFFKTSKRTTVKYRGDLDTTAHEVGHLIDDATGLVGDYAKARGKSPFDAELIPNFSQFGSGTASGSRGSLAYHRGEGVAEFIRAYLFNRPAAYAAAPKFAKHFETRAAEVLPQLRAFGDEVRRVAALDPIERGKLLIAWEPGRKTPAEKLKAALQGDGYDFEITAWDKQITRWVDDAHPAIQAAKWLAKEQDLTLRPTQDFELLLRTYVGGEATKIRTMLEEGIVNPDGKKLTDGGLAWVLEPIVGRRKEVPIEQLDADMKDTALMMIAERTIELASRDGIDGDRVSGLGKGLFSDVAEARAILDEYQRRDPAAYKRMQKSAERYRELSKGMLQYMVDAGRLSQETMDTITAGNQFYVDFSRDLDKQGFGMPGGGVAKGKNVVKRLKGGLDEINNPYRSLLENGFQMIGEADRNRVMRAFRDLVKPDSNDKGVNLSAIADEMPGVYNAATEAMEAPRDTITVYVDGKPEYWRINIPEVKKYLEGLGKDSIPEVAEATIGIMGKLMKAGVTSSPGYMVRNIIRDQLERPFKSRVGGSLVDNFSRIPKGTKEEFLLAGGGQFGSHVATAKGYEETLAKTMREIARDPNIIMTAPGKLLDGYNALKEKGELVTRLQEYKKAKEYAKTTLGYEEADARLYAAYQARDLMDFAVAGEWGRIVNAVVPFTNSKIQGSRRTLLAARENPKRFAANLAIMGISGAALVGLIKATGEDRLEEYREIPAYRRDLFWCIPVPGSSKWIYIPKGFEVAVMASIIERAANYALGDKRAFYGYLSDPGAPIPMAGGTLQQNLIPFDVDELAGPTKAIAGALANYDFFRQKPIVPAMENDKPLELRDTSRASRMGQWIEKITQLDARKADYLMGAMGGNVGRDMTRISDLGRPDKPLSTVGEFALSQTGVVGSAPGPEAISVQETMRAAKMAGMNTSPLKEEFDLLRSAKDPAQYDQARKNLVKAAKAPTRLKTIEDFAAKRKALDAASGGSESLRESISDAASGLLRGRAGSEYESLPVADLVEMARLKVGIIGAELKRSGLAPASEDGKRERRAIASSLAGLSPKELREEARRAGIK